MEFDDVVSRRRSVRSYKSKKAGYKEAMLVIDSAIQAPYSGNFNNLRFVITENPEKIAKLAELSGQSWITEVGLVIVVCSDDTQLENLYGERGRIYSKQQSGAAVEHMLLKATDIGIGSCWVGAFSDELIKQVLNIPSHFQVEALVPLGYEKKEPKHESRRKAEITNVTFWETWGNQKRPTIFAEPPRRKDPWM